VATILVVDDHEDTRELVTYILAEDGHEVLHAENGSEAIAVCRRRSADLVVLDVFMPGLNGIDTITEIRREQHGVKIVAVTAGWSLGRRDPLNLAREAGADATLRKPIDPTVLRRAVGELLAQADSGAA
jgi:CheY-like chemotaxis protein